MTPEQAQALQDCLSAWAAKEDQVRALALCGSWARRQARPDSDLDVITLSDEPDRVADARSWRNALAQAGFPILRERTETYGILRCRRAWLAEGAELEMGFAPVSWAMVAPVDDGTRKVVSGGFLVRVDKDGALARLETACRRP